MRTKRKGLLLCLLTLLMCACVAAGMTAVFGASGTDGYRYLLQFSDDFNGTVEEDWAVIEGGSSYSYAADEQTVRGWRFGGENHIAYKTNTTTDYGKFLYGNAGSANYMFEVKVKADVPEDNLQQYLDENAANLGAGLTLNTHLPFFVTDPSPDTNTHTFRGRSVCFSNYAIGFFEYSESGSGRWAQSVRIAKAGFDATEFSWRDWHTIRVEATAEYCRLWLDGVLLFTTPQSSFTNAPTASGMAGFAGICAETYSPLHFDDFRYWTSNPDYDETVTETLDVTAIDPADFTDPAKVDYRGSSFAGNLSVAGNKAAFNSDPGTDIRLLNEYSYGDFSMTVALDMDNQLAAKGTTAEDTETKDLRVSIASGVMFWAENANSLNGYMVSYMAYQTGHDSAPCTFLNLTPFVNGVQTTTTTEETKMIAIGAVSGTTTVVLDLVADSEAQTLQVTAYKSMEDKESGTAALTKTVDLSLTGCTYSEGHIGLRVNAGTTQNLIYEAEFVNFSAQTQVPLPDAQPVEEAATQTVSVTAGENGRVLYGGADAASSFAVATHSDVALEFAPAEGYIVDDVTINGQSLGALRSFTLQNVTEAYTVKVSFTDAKALDVYILAGQSNAAGFTPVAGLYKGYTYGGTVDEEKLAEYENGYTDVLYYGVTQSAAPATAGARLQFVHAGQGHAGTRLGPELGFAEGMHAYYGGSAGKAAVLKYAVGATSLGNFQNSTSDEFGTWMSPSMIEEYGEENLCPNAGLLYENLLVTVRMGLQAMIEAGYEPVIRGVMWMQGEADSTREDLANLYQKHLSALITDLRGDLTGIMTELEIEQDCSATPFVIGKIGADLQNAAYEDVVREQMQKTAASMTAVRCAETGDLLVPDPDDNNDVWHFSAKGILAVGNRFAEMLAQETGKKAQVTYGVSFDPAEGAFADPAEGATQQVKQWLTATEPEAPARDGYTFLGWFTGDGELFDFDGTAVGEDVALTAHWQQIVYTVTVGDIENGRVTLSAESGVPGAQITVTATPEEGFVLEAIYVNGQPLEGNSFTLQADSTVTASFVPEEIVYTVTVQPSEHGTVTVSAQSAPENTVITVTATPDEGYELAAIKVNGAAIEGNTFVLSQNSTVTAEFAAAGSGSVTPPDDTPDDDPSAGDTGNTGGTEDGCGGCGGSAVGAGALLALPVLGAACLFLRRKKN